MSFYYTHLNRAKITTNHGLNRKCPPRLEWLRPWPLADEVFEDSEFVSRLVYIDRHTTCWHRWVLVEAGGRPRQRGIAGAPLGVPGPSDSLLPDHPRGGALCGVS